MGGGDEQGRGGEHREAGEGDQAEPVQHHRRELPVVLHRVVLLVSLQLVVEDAQLLEDHRQLPHGARWQWSHLLRLEEGQFVWRFEWKLGLGGGNTRLLIGQSYDQSESYNLAESSNLGFLTC